ncbi:839_t:CDS:2, partial [Funneliformis caledonium]
DSFEALANLRKEIENVKQNINDKNSEHEDVGEIFNKVNVDDGLLCSNPTEVSYYSSGLFEEICFQCRKVPEDECNESDRKLGAVTAK